MYRLTEPVSGTFPLPRAGYIRDRFFFCFGSRLKAHRPVTSRIHSASPPSLGPRAGAYWRSSRPGPPVSLALGGSWRKRRNSCSPGSSPDQPKGDDSVRPTAWPFHRGETAGVMQPAPAHYSHTGACAVEHMHWNPHLRRPRPPAAVPSPTFIKAAAPGVLAPRDVMVQSIVRMTGGVSLPYTRVVPV